MSIRKAPKFLRGRRTLTCVFLILLFFLAPLASPICVELFWIQHSPSAEPLYQVQIGSQLGYIDQSGKVIAHLDRPAFVGNLDGDFHDGLLLFRVDGQTKLLDKHGKIVNFPNVDKMGQFSEGLAPARDKTTQQWGFINTHGDFVIPPSSREWQISEFSSFSDGMALTQTHNGYGFIDRSGTLSVDANLLEGNDFHDGVAHVIIEGPCKRGTRPCSSFPGAFVLPGFGAPTTATPQCKYAFIDKTGHPLFSQRFDDAKDFSEELAPVKVDGKWGFIDKTGVFAVKPQFDSADMFSDGVALVSQNGLFGFIAHSGAFAIEPQFKYAELFVDGLALVGDGPLGYADSNMYWYVDHVGRRAIPDSFPIATSFFKGLAHVRLPDEKGKVPPNIWTGKFAYIDRTGKRVFTYEMSRR